MRYIHAWAVPMLALSGCLLSGCQPDVRKAFNQDTWTIVGPDGMDAQDAGTHESKTTYAEGVLAFDDDGSLDLEKSAITRFFSRDGSSDNVSESFQSATEAWKTTTVATMQTITAALAKIPGNPFVAPSEPPEQVEPPPWAAELLDRITALENPDPE